MYQVSVLVSGGGGNLNAIVQRSLITKKYIVTSVVADRDCGAKEVAKKFGLPFMMLEDNSPSSYRKGIPQDIDLVVLAGYRSIVPESICTTFAGRIINTHPSLLPKHGGIGMIGKRVQQSVIDSGDVSAGCTVHRVVKDVDAGEILAQSSIEVPPNISAWDLGGLVFELEKSLLPDVILKFATRAIL